VIAAETGGKSPGGVRVFDRWNETEELLLDVERLLSERVAGADADRPRLMAEGRRMPVGGGRTPSMNQSESEEEG
jgi:hypothetical protein